MKKNKQVFDSIIICSFALIFSSQCISVGNTDDIENLGAVLEDFRQEYNVPALAAAVFQNDRIVACGVTGVRVTNSRNQITVQDRFHIGSCTKSFTSALIAILVEEGKLSWETKIIDVFPELKSVMNPSYLSATIENLLSHTSGLPNLTDVSSWSFNENLTGQAVTEKRVAMVEAVLKVEPVGNPGEIQVYSNRGYGIAAAIAEKVTGQNWESLIKKYILKPLELKSAGFGWPSKIHASKQPWGHWKKEGKLIEQIPDTTFHIPVILAPAGDIHLSIEDFANWTGLHLNGLCGRSTKLLQHESFLKIHTPVMNGYGLGWKVEETTGGSKIHWHNGSGGTFFASMAVFPDENLAVVVGINAGSTGSACQKILFELANDYANR